MMAARNGGPGREEQFIEALQPGLERACALIRKKKARLIGVQLPDGLRGYFRELAAFIEARAGAASAFLTEPCYGACMAYLPTSLDFVLHIAHDRILSHQPRIIYIPYCPRLDVKKSVMEALPMLKRPVGVVTTATHAHQLEEVMEVLRGASLDPLTARGRRTQRKGVLLGCDLSAARAIASRVGSFLFVGSGSFHPVGVELATGKRVVCADPYEGVARTCEDVRDRILRIRHAAVEVARDAKVFGVFLGLFPGQARRTRALALKRLLEGSGREALILAAGRFDPESLSHLGIDAAVSTACPRIAIEDSARYPFPVLTPPELEIALGRRKWEDYALDETGPADRERSRRGTR